MGKAQGGAWASQTGLRFQIPLQSSLHGIVKTHRPLAERMALLGCSAVEDESAYLCAGTVLDTGRSTLDSRLSTLDTLWGTL